MSDLKLVYVDDQEAIRMIMEIAMEDEAGVQMRICASGAEALALIPEYQPDMILLDVMMPEMDGPKTLEHIRALPGYASTPVVFVTAKVQNHEVEELKALGAVDVIMKPFDPITLPDQVRIIWEASCANQQAG